MSKPITMTYQIAMAAARDAGNRHMRQAGRTVWAVADWNHACQTFERLWPSSRTETDQNNAKEVVRCEHESTTG